MLDAQLPAGHEVEKSFLFAAVAYQLDLLDASRLAQAWQAWTAQRMLPLPDLLVQRGWLNPENRGEIERVLERKLKRHGGDPLRCLREMLDGAYAGTLAALNPPSVEPNRRALVDERAEAATSMLAVVKATPDRMSTLSRYFCPRWAGEYSHTGWFARPALALLVLLLMGLAIGFWLFPPGDDHGKARAKVEQEGTWDSDETLPRFVGPRMMNPWYSRTAMQQFVPAGLELPDPDAPALQAEQRLFYEKFMADAQKACASGDLTRAKTILLACMPRHPNESDLRGPEWYLFWRRCNSSEYTLRAHPAPVNVVAFSGTGKLLISGSLDGQLRFWDPKSRTELRRYAFNPNPGTGPPQGTAVVGFGPDGKQAACLRGKNQVVVVETETGKQLHRLHSQLPELTCLAFSPDGQHLATAGEGRTIQIWDCNKGELAKELKADRGVALTLAYNSAGTALASATSDQSIALYDVPTGQVLFNRNRTWSHQEEPRPLAFSRDGRFLAFGSHETQIEIWNTESGQSVRTLEGMEALVTGIAYSSDGSRIVGVTKSGELKIWSVNDGNELASLRTNPLSCVAISPDGGLLAAGTVDRRVKLWETARPDLDESAERAAECLVAELFARYVDRYTVADRVRADKSLHEPLRQAALRLTEHYPERALDLNKRAFDLNNLSWYTVRDPDRTAEEYKRALRQAEEACRLSPGVGYIVNTLGVAQYRMNELQKAMSSLLQSKELNMEEVSREGIRGPHPADVAFLAMTYAKLGDSVEAEAALSELDELLKGTNWRLDSEAPKFLEEARAVVRRR